MSKRLPQRTLAIIAHVDHGKTTLVDALFKQGGMYRANQQVQDRVMDSNDQERERGITILAKVTSVTIAGTSLQIVDTPGHADFGGEVERTLNMVDGCLLLVDAAEGPLPQTRFVLRKAFAQHLPIVVVINKIDRPDQRAAAVLDEIYDLFIDLGADDDEIDFPVVYCVARDGLATMDMSEPGTDLQPLVKTIIKHIPARKPAEGPFQMRVNQLSYDEYVGRLVIGRIERGTVKPNDSIMVLQEEKAVRARVTGLFRFEGVKRLDMQEAQAGDIIALAGMDDVAIGDTVSHPDHTDRLERITVDEPTVTMVFQVNDGPFAGKSGGKYVTSRHLRERLEREAFANVSVRLLPGDSPEQFRVLGRGELQLAVLLESLRRESYELCVRNPEVVTRQGEHGKEEPLERLSVDVPTEHVGSVTEMVGKRKGTLIDQKQEGSRVRMEYTVPTRGLFGLRGQLLTATRGTVIMSSVFEGWTPWTGPIPERSFGALVSDRKGTTTAYALFNLQPRGTLFNGVGTEVYEGMIIGQNSRGNDLNINCVREKKQTNVRASGKDEALVVHPPRTMSLEQCLEWIRDDEIVEVTPVAIRMRKRVLAANMRPNKRVVES